MSREDYLNASMIDGLSSLATARRGPAMGSSLSVADILKALSNFQECVRYLNTRRSGGAILRLKNEADVQDALFLILRPWLEDLLFENPNDKVANRYSIADFLVPSLSLVIEAKYIRNKDHGRSISKELHDDIESYRRHPKCSTIVFFLYDPNAEIPDSGPLRDSIEETRVYSGKPLTCRLIVKP